MINTIKPAKLQKGDTIGIISPAMPTTPSTKQNYERGLLYLITGQAGTEYFPPLDAFNNAILFWEETGKVLFNIVRSLYHLKYLGVFDRISGMVIGKISDLQDYPVKELSFPTPKEAIMDVIKDYDFPILSNVDFGHYTANLTMPIGVQTKMDATNLTFEILEAAVK